VYSEGGKIDEFTKREGGGEDSGSLSKRKERENLKGKFRSGKKTIKSGGGVFKKRRRKTFTPGGGKFETFVGKHARRGRKVMGEL